MDGPKSSKKRVSHDSEEEVLREKLLPNIPKNKNPWKAFHPICCWEIVWNNPPYPDGIEYIKQCMEATCKKWSFQLEKGDGKNHAKQWGVWDEDMKGSDQGTTHIQGRFSLKKKTRSINWCNAWFRPTLEENMNNHDYVTKSDTRIEGPWKWDDEVIYIPRQIREIKNLYPFQADIIKSKDVWDTRNINFLVDIQGNHGKSILATWIMVHRIGFAIPYSNDFKDIMRMAKCIPNECRKLLIIDLPRALKKDSLFQFMAGLEDLKKRSHLG